MASIIASPMTARSEKVSTTAMTTSALIIAIVNIIIVSAGGVKLSTVALVLAPVIVLLSPSPMLGSSMVSYHCIDPYRVCSLYYYLYNSHYDSSCLPLHTVLLAQEEGEVVEAVVEIWIYLYQISFLLYLLCF